MNVDHQLVPYLAALCEHIAALHQMIEQLPEWQQKLAQEADQTLCIDLQDLQGVQKQLSEQAEELATSDQTVEVKLRQYQQLFELAPDGYLVTDANGTIQLANVAAATLLKTNQLNLVGQQLISFVLEEERPTFFSQLNYQCKGGAQQEWELRFKLPNGVCFDAAVTVAVVCTSENQPITWHWLLRDITERKRTEVIQTKVRVLESMVEGVTVSDENGSIFFTNPAFDAMFGYQPGELLGQSLSVLNALPAQENTRILNEIAEQFKIQGAWSGEVNNRKKDETSFITYARISTLEISGKQYWVSVHEDITERKRVEKALQEKEKFLQLILDNIPQFIFWKDRNSVYLGCNHNFARAAGLNSPEEIVGKTDYDLPWKKEESDFYRECDVRVMETDTAEYHILETQLRADGKQTWLDTNKIPLHDSEGNVVGTLGTYEDITERKQAEEIIHFQAFHDLLTGLPNRTLFSEQLAVSLSHASTPQNSLAVMFLDLDGFKHINDTLGHAVGDQLLRQFAERLTSCLRPGDTLARWGGDEFTLALPEINGSEATVIAQQILDVLKSTFNLEGHELYISSSIGIALYPQDGEDVESLMRNADAALYRAKQQGRNNYQFYLPTMNSQASTKLTLSHQLYQALEREEFVVHYQPQVNIHTKQITGMEALVRWQHPQLGLIFPGTFIPLAEENGLIVPIGEWVLRTACAQNKAWQDAGLSAVRVAVNLSARQFQQLNLVSTVAQVLEETGLDPRFLELEITETVIMQNVEFTRAMLGELQAMGVHITMDDFGTGYSSLSYLKKFPFHTIKIDQSFVRELTADPQDMAIISAIATLGSGLNLRVIVEGVETKEQLHLLRSIQCQEMQGYLFSPSLSVGEATQLLRRCWLQALLIALHENEETANRDSFIYTNPYNIVSGWE